LFTTSPGNTEPLPSCPAPFLGLDLIEGGPFWPLLRARQLAREFPNSWGGALASDPPRSETFVYDPSSTVAFDYAPNRTLGPGQLAVRCTPISSRPFFEIVQKCRVDLGVRSRTGPSPSLDVGLDAEGRVVAAGSVVPSSFCSLGGSLPAHPPPSTLVAPSAPRPSDAELPDPAPQTCGERGVLGLKEGDRFWPLLRLLEHLDAHPESRSTVLEGTSGEAGLVWEWVLDEKTAIAPSSSYDDRRGSRIRCSPDVGSIRARGFTQAATRCELNVPHQYPMELALDEEAVVISAFHLFYRQDCSLGGERRMPADLPAVARDPVGRLLISLSRTRKEEPNLEEVVPALEKIAGVPAFLGEDPSGGKRHNPEFVRWLLERALPVVSDPALRSVAKRTYDHSARALVRGSFGMGFFFEGRHFGRDLFSDYRDAVSAGRYPLFPLAVYNFVSLPEGSARFWLARDADATAGLYRELIQKVMERFDPDYRRRFEAFADFDELPLYEVQETDLPRSITFFLGVEGQALPLDSEKTLTVVDTAGHRCLGRFARTSALPNDCVYETNPLPYLLGTYALEESCPIEEAAAILAGDVRSLHSLRFTEGPAVASLFGKGEVETELDRTSRVLYEHVHRDRAFPRLQLAGSNPTLGATEDGRFQIIARDVGKQCTSRSAGDIVEVECAPALGELPAYPSRFLFVDGTLVGWFRYSFEKTPLEGAQLRPVARYQARGLDVIVLSPGVALVRAGDLWKLLHRGGVVGNCDL
jgi:hypothetical protein